MVLSINFMINKKTLIPEAVPGFKELSIIVSFSPALERYLF